ncbi:hypothetical protein HJG53_12520 [Sphingomonas sp. ID1715]|uniref:hypothetical protein n=1 Tax=Sphingomonas sp. ID1715 TaxID=1656898 RepID=UPI0014891638|nr:hypothetical protein [Sphingomonas sp. ID1715]NNM77733.1 hypothetical protein [Sphingomonas sp. ID1715]
MIRRAGRICGLDVAGDRLMPLVGASLAGASLEHAAAAALVAQGVAVARLERAWALTPKAEKTLILENAASAGPTDRAAAKQFFSTMASLAVRAGAPPPAGRSPMNERPFRTYVDYFLGRAQREAFQLKIAEARR